MIAMRMVQMTVDEVVDMVAVRHRLVTTARAVPMAFRMAGTVVVWRAGGGIGCAHGDDVLIEMIFVRMMKMTVVQIVDMAIVLYRRMAAARTVLVRMVAMNVVGAH
jgi:hypothetical protein